LQKEYLKPHSEDLAEAKKVLELSMKDSSNIKVTLDKEGKPITNLFFCPSCNISVKDYAAYVSHLNGKTRI
jgi:hypothetical protein